MSRWICSDCGTPIEPSEILKGPRRGCVKCGSTARTTYVESDSRVSVKSYLKTHSKHREGGKKVVREVIEGDDFYRKTGRWSIMRRLFDRINDLYEESFKDRETGEEILRKSEPLSKHRSTSRTPKTG